MQVLLRGETLRATKAGRAVILANDRFELWVQQIDATHHEKCLLPTHRSLSPHNPRASCDFVSRMNE